MKRWNGVDDRYLQILLARHDLLRYKDCYKVAHKLSRKNRVMLYTQFISYLMNEVNEEDMKNWVKSYVYWLLGDNDTDWKESADTLVTLIVYNVLSGYEDMPYVEDDKVLWKYTYGMTYDEWKDLRKEVKWHKR